MTAATDQTQPKPPRDRFHAMTSMRGNETLVLDGDATHCVCVKLMSHGDDAERICRGLNAMDRAGMMGDRGAEMPVKVAPTLAVWDMPPPLPSEKVAGRKSSSET